MKHYDIAGITLRMDSKFFDIPEEFSAYLSKDSLTADCEVYFQECVEIPPPPGAFIYKDHFSWYAYHDGFSAFLTHPLDPSRIICSLTTDKDWHQATVRYLTDVPMRKADIYKIFSNIVIRNVVLLHQSITFHASAVKWQDKGVAFTAPSGTGKSTQAYLWETLTGASILNDDNALLKFSGGGITLHGTPWCGSGRKHRNTSVSLSAIIVLEQSSQNVLGRLLEPELSSKLLPRFFLPYHDPRLMDLALIYYSKILASAPIYYLQCRPDREAVQLVSDLINTI